MHPFISYLAVQQRRDEARRLESAARGRDRRTTAPGTRWARRERSLAAARAYRARVGYGL
jgi:hypothetical protein